MEERDFSEVFGGNFLSHWTRLAETKKPVIAAVNGYAVSSFRSRSWLSWLSMDML